ncbi:MAG: hypothetical protein NZ695_03610 [Dehalococcoidia bacterium]|jgi:hypothetical protein|nr:hypothetical protein [Dehalococcoidia bacterium]MDW8009019.1 hypothetical protein [Chloroflexota bacterium]
MEPTLEGRKEVEGVRGGEGRYSNLQSYFLGRLERLLRQRYEHQDLLSPEAVRLLDRAIYSTYCDCLDLGVGSEAQRLLRQFPVPSAGSRSGDN